MSLYSDAVIADGAIHYWRLDGSATDSIGVAHGTITGGVTSTPSGVAGSSAGSFDGTGKIVTAVGTALVTPFTIELWVKRNSNAANQVMFCNTWGAGDNIVLFVQPDQFNIYTGVVGSGVAFSYDTAWHHLACVCAGGVGVKLYIDGTTRTPSDPSAITFVAGVAKAFEIGFDPNWSYYNGALDEIAIYPRALTPAEILRHYQLEREQAVSGATLGSTAVLRPPTLLQEQLITAAFLPSTAAVSPITAAALLALETVASTVLLYEPRLERFIVGGRPSPGVVDVVGTYQPIIDLVGSYEG